MSKITNSLNKNLIEMNEQYIHMYLTNMNYFILQNFYKLYEKVEQTYAIYKVFIEKT